MDTEKFKEYTTEDFILDDDFKNGVLHPDLESRKFWKNFLLRYPEKKHQLEEAEYLIKGFQVLEPKISQEKLQLIYERIKHPKRTVRKIVWSVMKIAAMIIFLFSVAGMFYHFHQEKQLFSNEFNGGPLNKGKIILPDGRINEFDLDQTRIQQSPTGVLTINNDTITGDEFSNNSQENALAKVIIPYGKRSEITLCDGTKIWLNSGSQLSYPLKFKSNLRKVYLTGEAYFNVKSDPSKPFYVVTENVELKVTGTRFNVSSYDNEQTTQAVLVSGKVNISKNDFFSRSVELHPGERVVYSKTEKNLRKDNVNVELYTSWINGTLIFENAPIVEVLKKLERYYNKRILVEKISDQVTFSGKLDMGNDLEKVLKNICFSGSFTMESKDELFILRP